LCQRDSGCPRKTKGRRALIEKLEKGNIDILAPGRESDNDNVVVVDDLRWLTGKRRG
jgi:hypothetical protein